MIKKCVICGSDFEPRRNTYKTQICCSKKCSYINHKTLSREWARRHKDVISQKVRAKNITNCLICGERVMHNVKGLKPRMHTECIIEDCLATLESGKTLTLLQQKRAYSRGYTVNDLKELLEENEESECYM